MRSFYIFLVIIFLPGCSYPEMGGNTSNKIINILVNTIDKSIFIVGDKYTYVYQDKKGNTPYESNQYGAMEKFVNILKNSKGFSFIDKPKVTTIERKMLDGTTRISSGINLSVEIKPTQEQIDHFNTIKGYRGKNRGSLVLDGYTPRNLQLRYKKTKCFLGNCDDRFVEYILHYRTSGASTVRTTQKMKKIESRLHSNIVAQVKVTKTRERTSEELEKSRRKRAERKSGSRKYDEAIFAVTMIPLMIVSIPIILPIAALNSK